MSTRAANHTPSFLRAAATDPEGSLAYMLMSSFGITLAQCMNMVQTMLANKDNAVMMLCLTAAVQIRNNVVYVGPQFGDIRAKYPGLIIEGQRDVKDMFNYGACHICGHILAEITSHDLGPAILKKAGSCVTGRGLTETEAGKINAEIYKGFPPEDVAAFRAWETALEPSVQEVIDAVLASVSAKSANFATSMTGPKDKV